jgi:hypothetical protein
VQKVLLEEHPEVNLNILIVWLKMYASDSMDVVGEASNLFSSDPRVTQFYDPGKFSGLEVAEGFGAKPGEVAWDIYLFYSDQDEWIEQLPQPKDWVHQLGGSTWAEPGRFYPGDQLARKMGEIMESLP